MKPILCALAIFGLMTATVAHEGPCPFCKMPLVQNTKDQDNEVVLKMGNKRIEYRCLFCVMKDQSRYKGDLVVYAPSEKVGEPVVLKRTADKWTGPEGAVFLNTFTKHADCSALSRAFSNREAFDVYVAKHEVTDAKALTLDEFLAAVKKPKEKTG
jgi:hypothetical protein